MNAMFQLLSLTVVSLFFQDDFDDGNADGWFTVNSSTYEVIDGRYRFSGGGAINDATSYRGDLGQVMSSPDYSMTSLVEIDVGTFGGMMVRYREDGPYNLLLVLDLPGQSLKLYRWYFDSIELLDSHPMAVYSGDTYSVRFQASGNLFTGKAWPEGESEPSGWQVSTTDTLSCAGAAALFSAGVFKDHPSILMSCYFDDVFVEDPEPGGFSQASWGEVKGGFTPR